MKIKALVISPMLANVGVDKEVLERRYVLESNDSEKENFNLSLQFKTEPTKVLDQLLINETRSRVCAH